MTLAQVIILFDKVDTHEPTVVLLGHLDAVHPEDIDDKDRFDSAVDRTRQTIGPRTPITTMVAADPPRLDEETHTPQSLPRRCAGPGNPTTAVKASTCPLLGVGHLVQCRSDLRAGVADRLTKRHRRAVGDVFVIVGGSERGAQVIGDPVQVGVHQR